MSKFLSRNFHLTLLALVAGIVALFMHRMSGGEYVALATCVVTSFRAGDVIVNWMTSKGARPQ